MDLDPCLDEPGLGERDFSSEHRAVNDGKRGGLALETGMDVRQLVALIIEEILIDHNAVEHADRRHRASPRTSRSLPGTDLRSVRIAPRFDTGPVSTRMA
jgi:hypothetical protein